MYALLTAIQIHNVSAIDTAKLTLCLELPHRYVMCGLKRFYEGNIPAHFGPHGSKMLVDATEAAA